MNKEEFCRKCNISLKELERYKAGKINFSEIEIFDLLHIKNQTEEICLEAVKQNGYALEYVREQTEKIYKLLSKKYPIFAKYSEDIDINSVITLVKNDKKILNFLDWNKIVFDDIDKVNTNRFEIMDL